MFISLKDQWTIMSYSIGRTGKTYYSYVKVCFVISKGESNSRQLVERQSMLPLLWVGPRTYKSLHLHF